MKTKMMAHINDVLYNEMCYIMCYIMKCEWLKSESNCFVTCKYFQLILQTLQTVTNIYL